MPPRIPIPVSLRGLPASIANSGSRFASTVAQRRIHDPYFIAQAKARKAANLSRQQVLKKERAGNLGDPVRGLETPFLRSFDTATSIPDAEHAAQTPPTRHGAASTTPETGEKRRFFLSDSELQSEITRSRDLLAPTASPADDADFSSTPEQRAQHLQSQQDTAAEALRRIASLSLGSSQDRRRVNTQRCIDTFGRHATDAVLTNISTEPRVTIAEAERVKEVEGRGSVVPRIGPDTGSSEVQIAILTAKIRTLAEFLQTRGRTDKVNKRNLRLLVHRRQKLLRYLQRQDRGGSRWQHVTSLLGLTDGTWKGEISL